MAKLPPLNRIHRTDVPEIPVWMDSILRVLNSFMQNVTQALDNGLTLQDNLSAQYVDLQYTGGESIVFESPLQIPAKSIFIGQISGGTFTGGVAPIWQQIGQEIEITEILGTTSGETYQVRLLVL